MKRIFWFILTYVLLSACTAAASRASTSTPRPPPTATIVVKTSTPTQVQQTPTEEITELNLTPSVEPTSTMFPTSSWFDFSGDVGKDYSHEQIELITSGALSEQEERLNKWEIWWGHASNPPFTPGTTLYKVPLFAEDDPTNPDKTIVLWQALGSDYQGRTFYLPIDSESEKYMEFPPDTPVDTIPEGLGPLEVSGGEEGLILTNRGGELVRVDPELDTVVEKINFNTTAWEDEILENWEVDLQDGSYYPQPSDRARLFEVEPYEGGDMFPFGINVRYDHKVVRIEEITPEISEITLGFTIDGVQRMYKTLYTKCDIVSYNGIAVHLGTVTPRIGGTYGAQFWGLESAANEKQGWVERVFSEPEEENARLVWRQIKPDSQAKYEIMKFVTEGKISEDWEKDSEGVWDLTDVAFTDIVNR